MSEFTTTPYYPDKLQPYAFNVMLHATLLDRATSGHFATALASDGRTGWNDVQASCRR